MQNTAQNTRSWFGRLLIAGVSLLVLLFAGSAQAAGRVQWKSTTVDEREGGSWRLEIAIYLPSAPDVAHVPMRFEFQPVAYYERAMMDGDKLVERVVPLEHRQSLIESVDVGFLDSGSGKIEKRTRFTFKVTRAHGYEAGEYDVTIKDSRNGNTVGGTTRLKLEGENEIIDRRAMVFTGEKKKKPGDKAAADKAEAEKKAESSSGDASGAEESGKSEEPAPSEEPAADEASEESNAADAPPAIEEKPGGCGCRVVGRDTSSGTAALGLLVLGGTALLRRRIQRRAA